MHIIVHERLSEIDAADWNRLIDDNNPFLRHEFLHGLEATRCVCEEKGWRPHHIALYRQKNSDNAEGNNLTDNKTDQLIAAMPCYIKDHSYGEYIFDWSWVNAYHQHGIEYYPKLSNAVPFTPATGPRILIRSDISDFGLNANQAISALLDRVKCSVSEQNLSGFHSLFNTPSQTDAMQSSGLLKRHSTQFHWHNKGYQTFDDFLAIMSSKKRKNINRERRRIQESQISYRWLSGNDLSETLAHQMHQFYARTIAYYGAQSYLNRPFFEYIAEHFSTQTLFLFAECAGQTIAGGLYFKSNHTLYGRYWGALSNFHSVHFETCYYQAIEWCIKNNYQSFEAGAQGEHKLARGLEPTTTYSAHWISHPDFRQAIATFLESEEEHIDHYQQSLQHHSPFKSIEPDDVPRL